jgi:erythromycin esterase-like protein
MDTAERLRAEARPIEEAVDLVGDARFVLLGEASHGTAEFYEERARITLALARAGACDAVALEADWPDAWRVGCHVRGRAVDLDPLGAFERFPRWMWRNAEFATFVDGLRDLDAGVGIYGLDLYSLFGSIRATIAHLEAVDPAAAERARDRYACFDHVGGDDAQAYGMGAAFGAGQSCEDAVVAQLVEALETAVHADGDDPDAAFAAERNAAVVAGAERYYRAMFRGGENTWNLRDTHMADTLDAVDRHLSARLGRPARIVVWAHNSHLGDARATEMGWRGDVNLGQLVRERHPGESFHLGFTTATGTVAAADGWDGEVRRKDVRPPLPGSHEALLSSLGVGRFVLDLGRGDAAAAFAGERLERAIGVIYRPQTERVSHWFAADMAEQLDAVAHVEVSRAVLPLDLAAAPSADAAETWPTGV